ncbi:MAG: NAD-dependent deacylase [Sphingobacteriales bacterium]|nr:NAD-dependent deacylase [Sphingobacteriales bacterium]
MKHLVVLSGAGISAESGLATFRDSDGLWNNYRIEDVATPDAWRRNPALVLQFYNERRKNAAQAKPNAAHIVLAGLENRYRVSIITQNVDDLHERGGSAKVVHLHGKLREACSTKYPELIYDIGDGDINLGDTCEKGSQLRPNIVWFGEMVPMIPIAADICSTADIFVVIGTSLQVYPAAGLLEYAPPHIPRYLIDPRPALPYGSEKWTLIAEKATVGTQKLLSLLHE